LRLNSWRRDLFPVGRRENTLCEGPSMKFLHCSGFSPLFLGGNCHRLHLNRDKVSKHRNLFNLCYWTVGEIGCFHEWSFSPLYRIIFYKVAVYGSS
jgi:hypothetical protein